MEKSIVIEGIEVPFKSSGLTPLIYQNYFKRSILGDLQKVRFTREDGTGKRKITEYTTHEVNILTNVAWVFAKTADNKIPKVSKWMGKFQAFPLLDVVYDLHELIIQGQLRRK